MTTDAADSQISNPPVTFESNWNRPIRIESRGFAGPWLQDLLASSNLGYMKCGPATRYYLPSPMSNQEINKQ